MNYNQYRIGNYVNCLGETRLIEGISKRLRPDCGYFEVEGIEPKLKGIHIKPIPLTESEFLKLGYSDEHFGSMMFFKDDDYISICVCDYNYCFKYREWGSNNTGDWALYQEYTDSPNQNDDGVKYPISFEYKYVHQIQNLILDLIGKELTYITPTPK